MDDAASSKWDIIFKWFGLVGVLFGGFWTVWTYKEARTKEQNGYIFERQASLYLEAARSAATIAAAEETDKRIATPSGKAKQDALARFEQLYLGELVVVEDRRVELAMIAFHNCLYPQKTGTSGKEADKCRPPKNQFGKPIAQGLPEANLHNIALELAACTRTALQEDRQIQFGAVKSALTICPYD